MNINLSLFMQVYKCDDPYWDKIRKNINQNSALFEELYKNAIFVKNQEAEVLENEI